MLEPGESLFKLAIKSKAAEYYEKIADSAKDFAVNESYKSEILRLSVAYQLLTKEAAFIGIIKQDDMVIGEMTKVVIPTTLSGDQSVYNPNVGQMGYHQMVRGIGRGYLGGGSNVMRKSAVLTRSSAVAKECAAAPRMMMGCHAALNLPMGIFPTAP